MIKTFLSGCVIFTSFAALATEITSPFYLPQAGQLLAQTEADYIKNKTKSSPSTRTYRRTLNEALTLGLGGGFAALLSGELNWTKQKQTDTLSAPHTTACNVGLKGQWEMGGFLGQISALYHQTNAVNFMPRRTLKTHLRLGKALKTMTPYLHFVGYFPLNARSDANSPLYRAETGVFQPVNPKMTLDTALYLQYDKNNQERSYGIRGEWSYLLTSWIAFGVNGEWQARGKAHNRVKTYHQSVGAKITFSF